MGSLKKNIFFLYLLQVANYLVPLATLPYLSRVLGVEHFGVNGLAISVIAIMTMITDWGFSLTATQQIAQNANRHDILHSIFWDVLWARVGLGLLSFIGLAGVMIFVPSGRALGPVMLAASIQVLSSMFGVGWFLQGLERMGAYVWVSMFGRVLTVPLTFLFVHSSSDVAAAVAIPGICSLIACGASFHVSARYVALFPVRFNLAGMGGQLRSGAKIFLSTGAINLYTQSNILILSALTGPVQIGLFYGAERIRRAVQSMIGPANTALFPRINNLLSHDRTAAKHMMLRMLFIQGGVTLLTSAAMFVIAPWGVPFLLGPDYIDAVSIVRWLSPLPFIIGVSNVLGLNVMLPLGMKNEFASVVTVSAGVNFVGMLALCPSYGAIGAVWATLVAECFVTGAMALILYRRQRRGKHPA